MAHHYFKHYAYNAKFCKTKRLATCLNMSGKPSSSAQCLLIEFLIGWMSIVWIAGHVGGGLFAFL